MSEINKKIEKAFDSWTWASDLVHLNTKQADKFIDYIKDESVVLWNSRIARMQLPIENIAKINIWDEIFHPAVHWVALDASKRVEATGSKIQLIAQEVLAEVMVFDDELQDNIEGAAFTNHLLQMIWKKSANQLEQVSLYAKPVATITDAVNLYWMFTWAVTRAENGWVVVDASDTGLFSDRFIERAKFTKLYKSFPTKFRAELDGLYVPNDIQMDYEDLYNTATTTDKGAENRNRYAGVAFTLAPLMRTERPVVDGAWASTTMDDTASAWDTVIPVTATTGLVVWEWISITNADAWMTEYWTITAVSAWVSVTIDTALLYDQASWSAVQEVTFDWADILWTPKKNIIWGVYKDITIERERKAQLRWTLFVMSARMDFQVENVDALWLITNLEVK